MVNNNISQVERQIAKLQGKTNQENKRKAQILQRIFNLRQNISRNKNISNTQLANIERQLSQLN